jgi:hypothetical protein
VAWARLSAVRVLFEALLVVILCSRWLVGVVSGCGFVHSVASCTVCGKGWFRVWLCDELYARMNPGE